MSQSRMQKRSSDGTIIAVIAVCFLLSLMVNVLQNVHAQEVDQAWRDAAAPVFHAAPAPNLAERATPTDLAIYLNPCHARTWHERGRSHRPECDRYGHPIEPVWVDASFGPNDSWRGRGL